MNNKAEYNRCSLPRLTAKLGERELGKWREEDRRETEKEASIEEKIRIRKKERSKRRKKQIEEHKGSPSTPPRTTSPKRPRTRSKDRRKRAGQDWDRSR